MCPCQVAPWLPHYILKLAEYVDSKMRARLRSPSLYHRLDKPRFVPFGRSNLPIGNGAIGPKVCLGPVCYWLGDFGNLLELFEIKLDTESWPFIRI
jgi:hypothetical protein